MPAATIRDVAERAGVSIATVSRVLNRTSPVSEARRQLVLNAADALGYAPNPAALSLRGKRTGGIGALLPFISGEFFSELMGGMDEAARAHGYFLVVSTSHRRPSEFRRAMGALDRRVDALVVMAPELGGAEVASLLRPRTPVAFVNTYGEGLDADVFNFDNAAGARAATEHLLALGHRRIAFVHGPGRARDAQARAEGYRAAMAAAGLPPRETEGGFTREAGYAAATRLLTEDPRPTAVVAVNDYCALGVMSAMHASGVSVPGDVSIVGFDGLASAEYATPPLTTVRVPVREVGYRAVEKLVQHLAHEGTPLTQETEPVALVVRGSTSPPREA